MTWACPNCLIDWPEPFCDECGRALNVRPIHEPDMHSRRIPGVPDTAALDRIVRAQGIHAALMVASLDAVNEALRSRR